LCLLFVLQLAASATGRSFYRMFMSKNVRSRNFSNDAPFTRFESCFKKQICGLIAVFPTSVKCTVWGSNFSRNIGNNALYSEFVRGLLLRNFSKFLPVWPVLIQEDCNFHRHPSCRDLTHDYRPEEITRDLVLVCFLWPF
jgi:hypothetical protein